MPKNMLMIGPTGVGKTEVRGVCILFDPDHRTSPTSIA